MPPRIWFALIKLLLHVSAPGGSHCDNPGRPGIVVTSTHAAIHSQFGSMLPIQAWMPASSAGMVGLLVALRKGSIILPHRSKKVVKSSTGARSV